MRKRNGFTLIELLAIIVILAIIAVITIPIILNIIDNSKRGAAIDSAFGFKDAVGKFYVSELANNRQIQLEGEYTVTDGVLDGDGIDNLTIPLSGTVPSDGLLVYEKNVFKSGCLVIGEYAVSFDEDGSISTEKGGCGPDMEAIVDALPGTENTGSVGDGYKYIDPTYVGEHPVYYNPVTGKKCKESDYASSVVDPTADDKTYYNSESGYVGIVPEQNTKNQSQCLKWYAYSVKDGHANMILDHSINPSLSGVMWISKNDYEGSDGSTRQSKENDVGVTYPDTVTSFSAFDTSYGTNSKGPLTALKYLKSQTSSWSTSVQGDYGLYTTNIGCAKYSINYGDFHARMITAQEVANIKGQNFNESRDGENFWGLPNWLYENLSSTTGLQGYWTSSPSDRYCRLVAWSVHYDGSLRNHHVVYNDKGVRPVITVPASIAFYK